jgi:hypothetical protein
MFASAQKFGGGITDTDTDTIINVCRNQAINVTYTVGNNGSTTTTPGFRIFINTGPTSYFGGWNMFNGTATVGDGRAAQRLGGGALREPVDAGVAMDRKQVERLDRRTRRRRVAAPPAGHCNAPGSARIFDFRTAERRTMSEFR